METVTCDSTWRRACAASLAGLDAMTPARLAAILADAPPEVAWQRMADGAPLPEAVRSAVGNGFDRIRSDWRRLARKVDPLDVLSAYDASDVNVWTPFENYPHRLVNDPWAPAVLFWRGRPTALDHPTVAIIGTRRSSYEGAAIASQFGAELAEAGVAVVSGLALGIDGAAHNGALSVEQGAPPIGVAGNGLNVVYPPRHKSLWQSVGERGLLVSEAILGAKPEPWRFPARNRIIAGLADLVVVVESHAHGGSLLTVNEAVKRGVAVMAVPGSIRSRSAQGTNALISEGCHPACCTEDILLKLELDSPGTVSQEPQAAPDDDLQVLEAIDRIPTSTDEIISRTGCSLGEVASSLLRLQEGGWVEGTSGSWQRVDRP